ncbi:hypothetical protein ACFL4C_04265 [Candidatus Omnitrophota bacterium]
MIKVRTANVAVMVGGAPLSRDIAELYGADGYADNAVAAVKEAGKIISRLRGGD